LFVGYGIAGNRVPNRISRPSHACRIAPSRFGLEYPWPYAHSILAFQIFSQASLQSVQKVKAVLEKHPWYANQWQARLQDVAICLALVIIGNENDVQKRERATNRVANK
jgi:hypothetical protein